MVRHLSVIACLAVVMSCGGDSKKKPAKKPVVEKKEPEPPPETAEDRAKKREKAAFAIVPKESTCIPLALKEKGSPRLELAAVGTDAVLCATDTDDERLLGVIGCWKVDLASGELAYRSREPIHSRGFATKIDGKCAAELCLPKDSKVPDDGKALITANGDGSKWALLAGDDVHIYDGEKSHEAAWGIRGDKGIPGTPKRIDWVGAHLFITGDDAVYVYKADDGTAIGPIEAMGGKDAKPISPKTGSFLVLDKTRVGISEQGFTTVTTYEADTGKRAKIVRKLAKSPCKPAEADAYWKDDEVPAKCKDFMEKNFAHLYGADAVAGSKNLLVLLRGPRLGELAVLDAKTLTEKKSIRLPWCDEGDGGDEKSEKSEKSSKSEKASKSKGDEEEEEEKEEKSAKPDKSKASKSDKKDTKDKKKKDDDEEEEEEE